LSSQTTNPITIGMLYTYIAQKNNLPIFGVPIADHFILAYLDTPLLQTSDTKKDSILFYIDPTKKGLFLDKIKMEQFFLKEIENSKTSEELISFRPFQNVVFFKYWLTFTIKLFRHKGNMIKAQQLTQLLKHLESHLSPNTF
jgi:regulator of sirC expression with transglutaminase-like and TPR domain